MKKRIMAAVLACAMILGLTACGGPKPEELVKGAWDAQIEISEDDWQEDLENMKFYEAEIALADLSALNFVRTLTFNEDMTYSDQINEAKSRANIEAVLRDFFGVLYDNRATIPDYEGAVDDLTSVDDFIELYATQLFDYGNGDEMIQDMVDYVFSLYSIEDEEGTYVVEKDRIGFMTTEETEYLYAGYTISGSTMHITYSDGEEDFVKE